MTKTEATPIDQQDKQQDTPVSWQPAFAKTAPMIFLASLATLIFAILIVILYDGWKRVWLLYYFAPIAFPFVCFLIERANMLQNAPRWPWLVDVPVLALSITRAFYALPIISGHAFFLTYAVLTTRTLPARISAAVVLLEVAFLKIFLWHDATLLGGMAAAILSALALQRLMKIGKTEYIMQSG